MSYNNIRNKHSQSLKGFNKNGGIESESLKIIYTNADQLMNKMIELEQVVQVEDPDIVGITEVLPKRKHSMKCDDMEFQLDGYDLFSGEAHGRGVNLYVKQALKATKCQELMDIYGDAAWCRLGMDDRIVGCIYRSPSADEARNTQINKVIEAANVLPGKPLIFGDFNYPLIDWATNEMEKQVTSDKPENKFTYNLNVNYLTQHVTEATRCKKGQKENILDLIITRNYESLDDLQYRPGLGKSDHLILLFHVYRKLNKSRPMSKIIYKYEDVRQDEFEKYLKGIGWQTLERELNIEELWNKFMKEYSFCVDNFVPKKKVKEGVGKFKPKWINDLTKGAIKNKRRALKKYRKSKTDASWHQYKIERNRTKCVLRDAKKDYEQKIAAEAKTNAKSFWKYVKKRTGVRSSIADLRKNDGTMATDNMEKAEIFNKFFASVFTKENEDSIPNLSERTFEEELSDFKIYEEQTMELLMNLKPWKSMGPDKVHPYLLKRMATAFATPLTSIFRKSITEGRVPKDWKNACVIPIFKKGSKNLAQNYRPVSLTSIACKMMEKLIRRNIISHLNKFDLICDQQYGFRNKRSCVLQLLELMESWTEMMDDQIPFDTVYLDFSKAFDSVPHQRLLKKLNSYGISGNVHKWIQDFLTSRKQFVSVEGSESTWENVVSGVPQGSVLGPVLFIIYINDLPDGISSQVKIFADDTKVYRPVSQEGDNEKLQRDIDCLCSWSTTWQLKFNVGKCKVVHYGKNNNNCEYTMMNAVDEKETVKADTEEKDLGILFDSELNFQNHIAEKIKKAKRIVGLIKHSFSFMDCTTFNCLYKALVRPHIEYGNAVWAPHLKRDINALEKLQRQATKIVPALKKLTYEERLKALKLPTLEYRRQRGDLIQTYKIFHNIEDTSHNKFFILDTNITRGHSLKIKKVAYKKTARQNCFSNRVINIWNKLPDEIVTAPNLNSFKNMLDIFMGESAYKLKD